MKRVTYTVRSGSSSLMCIVSIVDSSKCGWNPGLGTTMKGHNTSVAAVVHPSTTQAGTLDLKISKISNDLPRFVREIKTMQMPKHSTTEKGGAMPQQGEWTLPPTRMCMT